jgi:hypothetical protein
LHELANPLHLSTEPRSPDPRLAAAAALRTAQDPARIVEYLGVVGLTDADVATGVGATERTVRRWRAKGPEGARPSNKWSELDDLRTVVVILIDDASLSTDGIIFWLRARNRALSFRRPLEVLGAGGFDDARDAALAFGDD